MITTLTILGVRVVPITENGAPGWRVYDADGSYVCRWSARDAAESVSRRAGVTVAEAGRAVATFLDKGKL